MKSICGFENYKITEDGVVFGARGKALKPDENSNGYLRVSLCKEGIVTRVFIHRLVAITYVDNPKGLKVINHKNGNRKDNRVTNIEWTHQRENVQDGFDRGRVLNNAPVGREKEEEVLKLLDHGVSRLKTAKETGISMTTINRIIRDYR